MPSNRGKERWGEEGHANIMMLGTVMPAPANTGLNSGAKG